MTLHHSPQKRPPYHTYAWVAWLVAAMLPTILTQNPFYLLLIILAVSLNYFSLDRSSPTAQGWGVFLRLGLFLVLFSILFNLVFVRAGATPLFTLPELRWETTTEHGQATIVQIGGKVSLESVLYGLSTGLALMALLLTFATFNSQVDHYLLLRSLPRFLYQSAIVMSIAITFIPHMFLAQREIREAQTLRGHRFRGLRDLLPLFVTLLAEGLERSLTLAESMEARGFGQQTTQTATHTGLVLKGLIALALLLLLGGAFAWSYFTNRLIGGGAIIAGVLLLVAVIGWIGRRVRRSRYRRTIWRRQDSIQAGAAIIGAGIVLGVWLVQRGALIYYPYPRAGWPAFNPLLGAALWLIAAPALLRWLAGWRFQQPVRSVAND